MLDYPSAREPMGVWGGLTEEDRERIYARNAIVTIPAPAAKARPCAATSREGRLAWRARYA